MIYAEAAYFEGAHVQHIADYYEHLRIKRLRSAEVAFMQRVRGRGGWQGRDQRRVARPA